MANGRYEIQSEFGRKFYDQGRSHAQAEAVLAVLARRGLAVTDEQRARVTDCTDSPTLLRWFDRAFDVTSVDELFA